MTINIDLGRLRALLTYEAATGRFIWNPRPDDTRANRAWNARLAGREAGVITEYGYRRIDIDGRKYRAHRLAWFYVHGVWSDAVIDHADRNRLNNAIANLREATTAENARNHSKRSDNKSGVIGVRFDGRSWLARLQHDGTTMSRRFADRADAVAWRQAAVATYHGAFAGAAA